MRIVIQELQGAGPPLPLAARLHRQPGTVLLYSALQGPGQGRYTFLAARPFLTLRAYGSRCEVWDRGQCQRLFGDPWRVLAALLARYELLDELDLPFPLGGVFGYWGYDLKNFLEPRLPRRARPDVEVPDAHLGFYDSLMVFDHALGKTWIVATGLEPDGSRSRRALEAQVRFWSEQVEAAVHPSQADEEPLALLSPPPGQTAAEAALEAEVSHDWPVRSNFTRPAFLAAVARAQRYIRTGDIYQVNLAQRLAAPWPWGGWALFQRLVAASPAPYAGWLNGGDFQLLSSSPELFLRLSGGHIVTRPIKGTRPRSADPARDARLGEELWTSAKERAELVMITDLLRNDLGRVCEYGSVQVPELVRLERFAHVQHLVSTVEGRLREGLTHLEALAACFPGGSITGAPKIRAMEIIDELEPTARGPYTGCLGYLGFNRESQLSILIRTALCAQGTAWFHVGAGIVADSEPEAEYAETLAKAAGFRAALEAGGAAAPALPTGWGEAVPAP